MASDRKILTVPDITVPDDDNPGEAWTLVLWQSASHTARAIVSVGPESDQFAKWAADHIMRRVS